MPAGIRLPFIAAGIALLLAQVHEATARVILPSSGLVTVAIGLVLVRGTPALSRMDGAWLLFLGAYGLATALGTNDGSLALTIPASGPALALYLLLTRTDASVGRAMVATLAALAAVQSIVVLALTMLAGDPVSTVAAARLTWLIVPNDIAAAACLVPWLWRTWSCGKVRAIGGTLLVAAACVALESRTALLALLAGLAAWTALGIDGARINARLALAVGVFAVPALVVAKGMASIDVRLGLWQSAFELWRAHPAIGIGPHAFAQHYGAHLDAAARALDPRGMPWPHSLPLELAAETGLVGLLAALGGAWLIAPLIRAGARTELRAPLAAAAAFAVIALFEATLLRLWVWNVLAVITGCIGSTWRADAARVS